MRQRMFSKRSWGEVGQQLIRSAVAEIDRLPESAFSPANYAGQIEETCKKYWLDVAVLGTPAEGRRRYIERAVSDGWGGRQNVRVPIIDVFVPFSGDGDAFDINPSRSALFDAEYDVRGTNLVLSVADDEQTQRNLDQLLQHIKGNLGALRSDVEQWKKQLEQAVTMQANHCRAEFAKAKERDSKLSFPVRG